MEIAVAILVAVIVGAALVYWFYLRKPKQAVPVPPVAPQAAPPAADEVEITEEELASLKEIPTLKKDLCEIKALLQELKSGQPTEDTDWDETELVPGVFVRARRNGHAEPKEEPAEEPKPEPTDRMAKARAARKFNK